MSPRSSVRRVFALASVALVLQYGVVGIVGLYASEPWPAIVLPAFKSPPSTSDTLTLDQPLIDVVFADSSYATLAPASFLPDMPRSHPLPFFKTQCRPSSLSGTRRSERCTTPAGRRWILKRAASHFPDDSIAHVRIRWMRRYVVPATGASSSAALDTLHLSGPSDF